ncbi:MAG: hypothetical protein ACK4E8_06720 [Lacibacter sp.]|jgi:hypothetical protein
MKRYLPLWMLLMGLYACNNDDVQQQKPVTIGPQPQQWFATDTVVVWNCDAAAESRTRVYKPSDSVPMPQPLINGINKIWPEPVMELVALRHDTVEVTLKNPAWLTGKSGNAGAEQYLSFAALNLLETKGVHYVHFNFPRGAHAGPSVWSGADFSDWKTIESQNDPLP